MSNTSLNNPSLPEQAKSSLEAALDDIPEAQRDVAVPLAVSPRPKGKRLFWKLLGLGILTFCLSLWLNYQYGVFTEQLWSKVIDTTRGVTAAPVSPSPGVLPTVPAGTPSPKATAAPSPTEEDLLGHLPYEEVTSESLESLTADSSIKLHKTAASAYLEMAEAARRNGVTLVPLSGFRTQAEQEYLFFKVKEQRGQNVATRAEVSAPPGYSEHHTGYAIDIGDGDAASTHVSESFEQTKAFKWLQEHAAYHSFELSFPRDNPQGVSYEPWHWRYVGDRDSLETFYKAKSGVKQVQKSEPSASSLNETEAPSETPEDPKIPVQP